MIDVGQSNEPLALWCGHPAGPGLTDQLKRNAEEWAVTPTSDAHCHACLKNPLQRAIIPASYMLIRLRSEVMWQFVHWSPGPRPAAPKGSHTSEWMVMSLGWVTNQSSKTAKKKKKKKTLPASRQVKKSLQAQNSSYCCHSNHLDTCHSFGVDASWQSM